jgi:hypothetical protein
MLFVSMLIVAILEYEMLKNFIYDKIIGPMSHKFVFLANPIFWIVIIAGGIFTLYVFIKFQKQSHNENKLITRVRILLQGIASGFKTILRMKNNGWFIFHTILIWVIYFLMTWVCFFCLDATAHLDIKAGMFVLVIGGLGMSAPVQGGIGAYHYIVSQGLQLFGISATDGIVYATLVHTSQTLLVVVLGLFAMTMLFLARKKAAAHE